MSWAAAKAFTSRRNRLPIWENSAGDGTGWPRWPVKNRTTCPPTCKFGTYAFNSIRSTHSTSRVTWPARTSLMFVTAPMNPRDSARGTAPPARPAHSHHSRAGRGPGGGPALPPLMVRRGFGLVGEGCSSSADFGEDLFGWLLPDERFGIVVPVFDPDLDRVDELVNAVERAAT